MLMPALLPMIRVLLHPGHNPTWAFSLILTLVIDMADHYGDAEITFVSAYTPVPEWYEVWPLRNLWEI
jgi:hypothetical protein